MSRSRVVSTGACLLLSAAACLTVTWHDTAAQEADPTARAIAAWSKTCQTCHSVPDPAFETDRAFLRQITETS